MDHEQINLKKITVLTFSSDSFFIIEAVFRYQNVPQHTFEIL